MESLTTQVKPANQTVRKSRRSNGRGTIRKYRKNQWRWLYRNADGRTLASGITRTKREAEDALDKISSAKQDNQLPDPQKLTVADFALIWLNSLDIRPNTRAMYEQELSYALTHIGNIQLQKLQPLEVKYAMDQVCRYVPTNRGKAKLLAKRTLRMVRGRLKSMLASAVRLRLLMYNPADCLEKVKTGKNPLAMRGTALTPEQADRFFDLGEALHSAGVCRLWAALYLGLSLGLRRGEIMGLRWQDLDFENEVTYVNQNLTELNGEPILSETKTEESKREIPMLATVKAILERHRTEQALEQQAARDHWQDADFVFATTLGSPTHPATLYRSLQSLLVWSDPNSLKPKKIQRRNHSPLDFHRLMNVPVEHRASLEKLILSGKALPHLRPHDLRHTAATLMMRAGMSIDVVSKILGHARISITTDVYRQVRLEEKRAKMIDLFAGKKVTKKPE